MKRFLVPVLAVLVGLVVLTRSYLAPAPKSPFNIVGFGELPVLANGRLKPIDTVARNTILSLQGRQRVALPEGGSLTPIEWMLDASFAPEKADKYRTFEIDDPDLLSLIGQTEDSVRIHYDSGAKRVMAILGFLPSRHRRFSYADIAPHLAEIDRQGKSASESDPKQRTRFQKAVSNLRNNLVLYQGLQYSLTFGPDPQFFEKLGQLERNLGAGVAAMRAKMANQPHDEALANSVERMAQQFIAMAERARLLAAPPPDETDKTAWKSSGDALLNSFRAGQLDGIALAYAALGQAWRQGKHEQFNTIVRLYRDQHLASRYSAELKKVKRETAFNKAEPFYTSMVLYAIVFLTAVASLLKYPETLRRAAFAMLVLAGIATTVGILTRMSLEGRPPVTNLHSSALFIGWAVVIFCIVLERIYRMVVPTMAAGVIGFCTMLIAHHLAIGSDTLEMMQAVLDSNFWLATHVVVITLGYGATFLAGFLAIIYIVLGLFTKWLPRSPRVAAETTSLPSSGTTTAAARGKAESVGEALGRMVYGIVCFATLFSLVGTILGGIWADQSWGRFWGWDPKENGALIIVLWNALILHARWGGLVKTRGIMCLAVFGNVVTAWSWFGTNMLGIGLHSYGFMEAAFYWLLAFVATNVLIIGAGLLPMSVWRSFQGQKEA